MEGGAVGRYRRTFAANDTLPDSEPLLRAFAALRERYPADSWVHLLTDERCVGARRVFAERRRRNEANDLSDCLQLGDKATILMKDRDLFALSGFASKRALETFFKDVGLLRNALAHANDILSGRWPALVDLVTNLEALLERLEGAAVR